MDRKLFSLAGVSIAVFSFTIGGTDAEAGRRCNRSSPQYNICGCQQPRFDAFNGITGGRPFGDGGFMGTNVDRQSDSYGYRPSNYYGNPLNYAISSTSSNPPVPSANAAPTVVPAQPTPSTPASK